MHDILLKPARLERLDPWSLPRRIRADAVFTGTGPLLEPGVIEISDGVITAVECHAGPADGQTLDFGKALLMPGLVNAHAHLEFGSLSSPIEPPAPFSTWIQRLLRHRRERPESMAECIDRGRTEAGATGTCAVADIVTGDWSPGCVNSAESSAQSGMPAIVAFRELIGLRPEQAAGQLAIARQHLADCSSATGSSPGPAVLPALSPHAPYSVGPELYHLLVELAREAKVSLCVHLAETQAELQLLADGTGDLADMLSGFGLWTPDLIPRGTRPRDYLEPLASLDHALIAHGNYLSKDEIDWLGQHPQVAVVYCPRTHAFFGHRDHPWQRLVEAGATVVLGTDGRSSNPDYSLWAEFQWLLHGDRNSVAETVRDRLGTWTRSSDRLVRTATGANKNGGLRMLTRTAAEVLGLADGESGSGHSPGWQIAPGEPAVLNLITCR